MLVDIDYFIAKTNINKEELEKLSNFEIKRAFERMFDIARSYGLRKVLNSTYTFDTTSNTVNMNALDENFDVDKSFVVAVFSSDYTYKYSNYILIQNSEGKAELIFRNYFSKGDKIQIIYEIPYTFASNTYKIDINISHLNILHLLFEGCLYERMAQYYSKLSMQDVGAELTNNIERARMYQDKSDQYFKEALRQIKTRHIFSKSIQYSFKGDWLTHNV